MKTFRKNKDEEQTNWRDTAEMHIQTAVGAQREAYQRKFLSFLFGTLTAVTQGFVCVHRQLGEFVRVNLSNLKI